MLILPHLKGLPVGSAGSNAFKSSSLDLNFAVTKSLIDSVSGNNLVTFTRASSGTFVGSDGLIKTAVTNLLLRSEEFQTFWGVTNSSVSADTSETLSPTGLSTADKLTASAGSALKAIFQGITSATGTYTFSVYAKKSNHDFIQFFYGGTGQDYANFNISTGATGTTVGTSSIASIGNGWYRCVHTFTASANTSINIALVDASTSARASSSSNTNAIYLWGAQLEQSSTVGEYIPTTSTINSAPRFDHNPTTTESLGLLVEEQRTNSTTYSQDFGNAAIGKNNSTVTDNTATSPAGDSTADKVIEDVANSEHGVTLPNFSYAANTVYTFTIFAKAVERNRLRVLLPEASFGQNKVAWFDLSNGSVIQTSGTGVTSSVAAYPNGWYRCAISATTTTAASGTAAQLRLVNTGTTVTYTGDNTSGLLLWGAQLEAGAFATSYIPTTTATVTRSADVASITGTAFSSWYRQDEGTVFVENSQSATTGDVAYSYYMDAGAGLANSIYSDVTSGNRRGVVFSGNVVQCASNFGAITTGVQARTAFGIKQDQFGLVLNGGMVASDNTGSVPSGISRLSLGNNTAASAAINGTIKRLVYWPRRLGNEVLQEVTR
jgi:hypothetical protein